MSLRCLHSRAVCYELFTLSRGTEIRHGSMMGIPVIWTLRNGYATVVWICRTLWHRLSVGAVLFSRLSFVNVFLIDLRLLPAVVTADGCWTGFGRGWQTGSPSSLVAIVHRALPLFLFPFFLAMLPRATALVLSWGRRDPSRTYVAQWPLHPLVMCVWLLLWQTRDAHIRHRPVVPFFGYGLTCWKSTSHTHIWHRSVPFQSLTTRRTATWCGHHTVSPFSHVVPWRIWSLSHCLAVSSQSVITKDFTVLAFSLWLKLVLFEYETLYLSKNGVLVVESTLET